MDTRIPVGDAVWGSLVECPMKHIMCRRDSHSKELDVKLVVGVIRRNTASRGTYVGKFISQGPSLCW